MFNFKKFFRRNPPTGGEQVERNVYQLIIKTSIYLTILLVPVFCLPLAYDLWELPKALLFYFLVLPGLITWLIHGFVQKKVDLVKTPFNFLVLLFGLIYLLAAIFSANRFHSFWGGNNQFNASWLTNLFFIGWFFLLINHLKSLKEIIKALMFFVLALALAVIFSFGQIFGLDILVWLGWSGLPFFNLTGGSAESLTILLAVGVPLLFILWRLAQKRLDRIILAVLLVIDLALIFILSQRPGLTALIFGLFVLLFFLAWPAGKSANKLDRADRFLNVWLIILIVLIVLAVVALFLPLADWLGLNLPANLRLPGQVGWQITVQTLKDHWLFGVGPQNFPFAFAQYRPLTFNQSAFWNIDFISSGFQWLDVLITLGLAGSLVLLVLGLKYLGRGFWVLLSQRGLAGGQTASRQLAIGVFAAWLTIIAAGFLTTFNFTLIFLTWSFLALGVLIIFRGKNSVQSFSFNESSLAAFFSSLVLIVLLVLGLGIFYFGGRALAGEVYFTKAVLFQMTDIQEKEQFKNSLIEVRNWLVKAIKANPGQARFHLALAQNLNQTIGLAANQTEAQNLALAGLNEVGLGLTYNREFISYYRAAAEILENLRPIVPQANEVLITALQRALVLSPNNPVLHLNLGRAYLFGQSVLTQLATIGAEIDQQFAQQAGQYFRLAGDEFQKAVALKSQWAPARYQLALFLEQQGKISEAIPEMELAWQLSPDQAQTAYHLGRLYKNQGRPDEALKFLAEAVKLNPNLLNAHLELIDIYESGGDKEKAIEAVRRALEKFPDNEELKAKLTALGKKK